MVVPSFAMAPRLFPVLEKSWPQSCFSQIRVWERRILTDSAGKCHSFSAAVWNFPWEKAEDKAKYRLSPWNAIKVIKPGMAGYDRFLCHAPTSHFLWALPTSLLKLESREVSNEFRELSHRNAQTTLDIRELLFLSPSDLTHPLPHPRIVYPEPGETSTQ